MPSTKKQKLDKDNQPTPANVSLTRRPRRNRASEVIRSLVRETRMEVDQLVYPFFVMDGENQKVEVKSLPGNYRWSIDLLLKEIEECVKLGLKSFILFPVIEDEKKDPVARLSYDPNCVYLRAIREIKKKFPDVCVITDVAMDPYSSDGHDGYVSNGKILNDETLEILAKMAVEQAKSGADIIGPSDMMDGRVGYIRQALDKHQFQNVGIMSYTAKYASAFYGPFRDALNSAPKSGDKKTYQMDPSNKREAIIEAELDVQEGADYLMVKPALPYLDVIHILKERFHVPIAAYNVSGECAMLIAASQNGWLDFEKAMSEMLLSIHRAGADIVITYFAKEFAKLRKEGKV